MMFLYLTLLFLALIGLVSAATLETVGAYPCSGEQSIISVSNFSFTFDKNSNNVSYTVEAFSTQQVQVLGKSTWSAFLLFTFLIPFSQRQNHCLWQSSCRPKH